MKKFVFFMMGAMLIFSFILTACSDEPDSPANVVTITVRNIPAALNGTAIPYKVYVQLSNARSSADTHVAEGRKSSGDKSIPLSAEVQEIELYFPDSPPTYTRTWTGRANYASVVICPASAGSFDDLEMYGFTSVPEGPNAVLDISRGMKITKGTGNSFFPPDSDLDLMFTDTISGDPDPDRPDTP
ncbi:MAG: hypothetical protein FWG99_08905 [Treponema sp.]|nr:hypothetical protein [Treponema sp.]